MKNSMTKFIYLIVLSTTFVVLSAVLVAQENKIGPKPTPSPEASERDIVERNTVAFPIWRLHKDWMYQDHGPDVSRCFTDAESNGIESRMVRKVLDELNKRNIIDEEDEKTLSRFLDANIPGDDGRWRDLYFRLCEKRRRARLGVFDGFSRRYVYAKHFVFGDAQAMFAMTTHQSDAEFRERGYDYTMGSELCLMTIHDGGKISTEVLLESPDGVIRDPCVSFDGSRIAFSMRNNDVDDDFHLYVMDVESRSVRQITQGPGTCDIEPCYLPSGEIVFNSTRCDQSVPCWWSNVTNLYVCDGEGRYLRRLGYDQAHTLCPSVLPDSRILYTRWEYMDRLNLGVHALFVMNPDGTNQTEYYGNNSLAPIALVQARAIPGTQKVLGIMTGHHVAQHGKLVEIDRSRGTQGKQGLRYTAPNREIEFPKADMHNITSGLLDTFGFYGEQYQYPYPLDEDNFLVSYLPDSTIQPAYYPRRGPYPNKFGIYWMHRDGSRELLLYDPTVSSGQHVPLASRPAPPMRTTGVDYEKESGTFYVQDVYVGPGLAGIARGAVKKLRVVGLEYRAASTTQLFLHPIGDRHTTPIAINNGSGDVKHVLGTVDVEEDGSVCFEVPARTPVFFQMLDENGHVVQTMRSWTVLMPGETISCIGCHEDKSSNTIGSSPATLAMRRGPRPLEPFFAPGEEPVQEQTALLNERERRAWKYLSVNAPQGEDVPRGFSYRREIQPIWDRHCISCHIGTKNPDKPDAPLSLLGDSKEYDREAAMGSVKWKDVDRGDGRKPGFQVVGRDFSESYLNLTTYGHKNDWIDFLHSYSPAEMIPPYSFGSSKSKLMKYLEEDHYGVRLSREEKDRVACWIDLCIPFCGSYMEANTWDTCRNTTWHRYNDQLRGVYLYHEMKRLRHAEVEIDHLDKYKEHLKTGKVFSVQEFASLEFGGPEIQWEFLEQFRTKRESIPIHGVAEGLDSRGGTNVRGNPVRNLAVNPQAATHQIRSYPHVSSNSHHRYRAEYSPKNAIDGNTSQDTPYWKPDPRTDLWIQVDFGRDVKIEKIVLHLKKIDDTDKTWASATLNFSGGEAIPIELKATCEPQEFVFPARKTSFVRIDELKETFPLGENGVVECEMIGKDILKH